MTVLDTCDALFVIEGMTVFPLLRSCLVRLYDAQENETLKVAWPTDDESKAPREFPRSKYLVGGSTTGLLNGGGKDEVAGAAGSVILSRNLPNSQLHIFQEAGHGTYSLEREGFRDLLLRFAESNSLL